MKLLILFLSFSFFLVGSITEAASCDTKKVKSTQAKPVIKSVDNNEILKALRSEVRAMKEQLDNYQSDTYQVQLSYYKKYHEYLARKADINLEQFLWQRRASEFLLWLVVTVVISGISFSGIQLWRASSLLGISTDSTIEIAAQKIKVTSSVVGVIVLTISIIFLYFFLIEVYRVKIVDLAPAEVKPTLGTYKIPTAPDIVANIALQPTVFRYAPSAC